MQKMRQSRIRTKLTCLTYGQTTERAICAAICRIYAVMGVRTERQMGSADPLGKTDEKLKSENMQKEQFSEWSVGVGVIKLSSPLAARGR